MKTEKYCNSEKFPLGQRFEEKRVRHVFKKIIKNAFCKSEKFPIGQRFEEKRVRHVFMKIIKKCAYIFDDKCVRRVKKI